ncbi:MAG TPA: hypothetical protein VJ998_11645 [Pseudomonadales bacterium]|nr:hypothetical protein [Pseudomonadales bacterium]
MTGSLLRVLIFVMLTTLTNFALAKSRQPQSVTLPVAVYLAPDRTKIERNAAACARRAEVVADHIRCKDIDRIYDTDWNPRSLTVRISPI